MRAQSGSAGREGLTLVVQSDGASRGNPGLAGAGVVIRDVQGTVIREIAQFLGSATNNQAEYLALIIALKAATELGARHLEVQLDSELLVKQLNGEYRVRNPQLIALFGEANRRLGTFASVRVRHIRRAKNAEADRLANQAIDQRTRTGNGADEDGG